MLSPGVRPEVNSTPAGYFVAKIIPGYMQPALYKYTYPRHNPSSDNFFDSKSILAFVVNVTEKKRDVKRYGAILYTVNLTYVHLSTGYQE